MLMTNYSEIDLVPAAVEIIKTWKEGIDTQNLVKELRKKLKPSGADIIILANRNDDKFSQKVRNLKSHKTLEKKDLVIFKKNKFFLTTKGEIFIEEKKNKLNLNDSEIILNFVPLKYFNFSVRTLNSLLNEKCEYVYDLNLITNFGRDHRKLLRLRQFGKTSLLDIEKFYLNFSKYISPRVLEVELNHEKISIYYKKEKKNIEKFIINHIELNKNRSKEFFTSAKNVSIDVSEIKEKDVSEIKENYIEEIIISYLKLKKDKTGRESIILTDRIFGNQTLDKIGKEYNVTRERIRQQEAKLIKKIKQSLKIRDCINKISKVIEKTVFKSDIDLLKKLFELNLAKGEVGILGIKKLLEIFKLNQSEQIQKIRGNYYIFESSYYRSSMMSLISRYIRDSNHKYGIVNISLLQKELQSRKFVVSKNLIIKLINTSGNSLIINNEYYLISSKDKTNLLIGCIHSTMSVTNKIEINDLYKCIKQYRRLNNFSPPVEILKLLCVHIGYESREDFILNNNYSETNTYLVNVRKKLFNMFLDNGRVMTYEQILDQHSKYGLNMNSVNVMIYENLFCVLSKGIFALAGTEISEENLEILEDHRKNALNELTKDLSWSLDSKGNVLIRFNKMTFLKGPFWLPPALKSIIPTGNYSININNKVEKIQIYSSRIYISGNCRNFISTGTYKIFTLKFNTIDKKVIIENV